jgi:hypothetical protein
MRSITGSGVALSISVEWARVEPAHVTGEFDRGDLQAEADAEEGHLVFARPLDREDHTFDAARAESARDEKRVSAFEATARRRRARPSRRRSCGSAPSLRSAMPAWASDS